MGKAEQLKGVPQDVIDQIDDMVERYYWYPLKFVKEVLLATPTKQQEAVLVSIAVNKKVSIKAGHGVGKSTVVSWIILWYLITRGYPKIICTAPTYNQLHDILWAEIANWMRKSQLISDWFTWTKTQIAFKGAPENWFAAARTASKGEALAGRHADNFMLVVDEASGVDDEIYEASEGMLTGENTFVIMISNPTKGTGYFFDTFTDPEVAKNWKLHSMSCVDSLDTDGGLVSQRYIDNIAARYGRDSNVFRVRVLGEFPTSDKDALIPRTWVEAAIDRDVEAEDDPLILGVDVGAGGDLSAIAYRRGNKVEKITTYNFENTMDLVKEVALLYKSASAYAVCIDPIGIGKGAYDRLAQMDMNIFDVDVRRSSFGGQHARLRDELYWKLREQFERGTISIPYDKDLILELSSIKYDPQKGNKIQSKAEMKRPLSKGGMSHSPDRLDSVMLTEFLADNVMSFDDDDILTGSGWGHIPALKLSRNSVTGY